MIVSRFTTFTENAVISQPFWLEPFLLEETDLGQSNFSFVRPIQFWIWCVSWWARVGPRMEVRNQTQKSGSPEGWGPEEWGPEGWEPKPRKGGAPKGGRPKISRFFFPSPAPIFILSPVSWWSSRGILVLFEAPGPTCTNGILWVIL